MQWTWNWWIFVPAVILFTIISMFARGAGNAANVARYGPEADYRHNVPGAIFAAVVFGVVIALVVTSALGFLI